MTAIYGTLGPACADLETLTKMFAAGMTGMRLNLSHTSLLQASGQIEAMHEAAARNGKTAQLLIDLQGPELRIGDLSEPRTLVDGSELFLGEGGIPLAESVLSCLRPGQQMLLDDGKFLLEILYAKQRSALARVVRGGVLRSRKSIAIPDMSIPLPAMTPLDRENISLASEYGVTAVMQPFVRDRNDLETVREALHRSGCADVRLLAKIESREGAARLEELIPACDEIVIARGDLGNAMPLWELPAVQKKIAAKCRRAGRDFMVVTQMLTSMEHSPVPTRAEVSDVFNAVCDGAVSVMLTGETAVGEYPAEAIRYLARTVKCALEYLSLQMLP